MEIQMEFSGTTEAVAAMQHVEDRSLLGGIRVPRNTGGAGIVAFLASCVIAPPPA
jgi:hypothetical protein